MKSYMKLSIVFSLLLAGSALSGAQDENIRSQIEAFYHRQEEAVKNQDIGGWSSLFADDFSNLVMGKNKQGTVDTFSKIFSEYEETRLTVHVLNVSPFHEYIRADVEGKLEVKKNAGSDWHELMNATFAEFLVRQGDTFQIISNANLHKDRLNNIQGQTYKNEMIGFSFTAPEGWTLIPSMTGNMMEVVFCAAPDLSRVGMFGLVELPYSLDAKAAVEGDDSAAKNLSTDFELISSAPTRIGNLEGFESQSRFTLNYGNISSEKRYRWRIYFKAGGVLFTFNFDAIPPEQWDVYKQDFESILNSFTLTADAEKNALQNVREQQAQGEVVGRIYTNDELGFQIAAPEGWTMEPATISESFRVSLNIKPQEGNSIVRLLAIDVKNNPLGKDSSSESLLQKTVDAQQKAIDHLAKDVTTGDTLDTQVGGHPAKTFTQEFTLDGLGSMKRKNVFFVIDDTLYMFLCDALPPSEYEKLEPDFDQIVQLFTLN